MYTTGSRGRRLIVEIKPGYRCNQKCSFCLWESRKSLPPMSTEAVVGAIRHSQEALEPRCFILSGGEPTMRSDFPQIVEAIGQYLDLDLFHLHTNATLVPKYRAVLSRRVATHHSATVGIHGHTPVVHEGVTGIPGSFHKGIQGIRTLLDIGFEVRAACVICSQNFAHLSEITSFLLTLGVQVVEMRLPIAGPGRSLSGIMVERHRLEEQMRHWSRQFACEPRAHLVASNARCFHTLSIEPEDCTYHFFDGRAQPGEEGRAASQLAAIWPEAYDGYQKSGKCRQCVLNEVCEGFSKEEVAAGYADYLPVDLDSMIAQVR